MTNNYGKRLTDWRNWQNWENWENWNQNWSSYSTDRRSDNDKRENQGRRWDDRKKDDW